MASPSPSQPGRRYNTLHFAWQSGVPEEATPPLESPSGGSILCPDTCRRWVATRSARRPRHGRGTEDGSYPLLVNRFILIESQGMKQVIPN